MRLGVLVSGRGSILESLLHARLPIVLVVADRPCPAIDISKAADVQTALLDRNDFGGFGRDFDRELYTRRLVELLESRGVELIAMAGFGTVLTQAVHDAYPGRILNTHPSLLPAFPGWHAVQDALSAGVEVTGCTVHLATLETDAGPVLAQEEVAVLEGDTVATLHERIKEVERRLYPATIKRLVERLSVDASSSQGASR